MLRFCVIVSLEAAKQLFHRREDKQVRFKNDEGFPTVESFLVVATIGIIAAILVSSLIDVPKKEQQLIQLSAVETRGLAEANLFLLLSSKLGIRNYKASCDDNNPDEQGRVPCIVRMPVSDREGFVLDEYECGTGENYSRRSGCELIMHGDTVYLD